MIEVSQPTPQYTAGGDYAYVQFQWRVAASDTAPAGIWHKESYSPTQAQLSARAPTTVLALAPGYWGDMEVRADVAAFLEAQYGFTSVAYSGGAL